MCTLSLAWQLSFESGSKSTREFADVVEALVDAAGKRNDAFGTAEDSQALVRDWLARVGRGEFEDERGAQVSRTMITFGEMIPT